MSDRARKPILPPARRGRRRRPLPRRLRIAAILGGLGLAVLVAVTLALMLLDSVDQQAAMSQGEYTQRRWGPHAGK